MYNQNPNAPYIRELIDMGSTVKGSAIKAQDKEQVKLELALLLKQQFQQSKDINNIRKKAY